MQAGYKEGLVSRKMGKHQLFRSQIAAEEASGSITGLY